MTEHKPTATATDSPRRTVLRIGLAQLAPSLGDLSRNLAQHHEWIERARQQDCDLLVFPELSLTGYDLRDQVPEVALSARGPQIQELIEAAGPMAMALGFVEQGEHFKFYNSAVFSEDNQVRHVHRKVYLPTYGLFDERRYFAPGERMQAFDTERFGRVGMLVCEDFWHLSAAFIMQAQQVDLLLCLANSPARGVRGPTIQTKEVYELLGRTYAGALGAAIAVVNRSGYEDGLCFWGGSQLISPGGRIVAEAPLFDEELLVAEFDPNELRRERIFTPLGRDEKLLLTIEELERIRAERFGRKNP